VIDALGRVLMVVEGKAGANGQPPGIALGQPLPADGRPHLLIEASRPLGNGNPAVICPDAAGDGSDGIPAVEPPNFGPDPPGTTTITDALKDVACRFISRPTLDPCTLNAFGDAALGNGSASPTVQFCGESMVSGQAVAIGDTRFTARLRDISGTVGPPEQIIVRRPTPPS